jgi:hypothetical protein
MEMQYSGFCGPQATRNAPARPLVRVVDNDAFGDILFRVDTNYREVS